MTISQSDSWISFKRESSIEKRRSCLQSPRSAIRMASRFASSLTSQTLSSLPRESLASETSLLARWMTTLQHSGEDKKRDAIQIAERGLYHRL